jgi:hypothetical protein
MTPSCPTIQRMSDEEIIEQLTTIKGVGRWVGDHHARQIGVFTGSAITGDGQASPPDRPKL